MSLGAVSTGGLINISTTTGDLTLTGNVSTTSADAAAIQLNAGSSASAGTATGGNIVLTGSPTVTVGTGGKAILYTGSVSGSTGLTTLVGSGSGRFRYNSDETTTNYTTALTAGLNAVYREAVSTTSTATTPAAITYGAALPTLTGTAGSLVNGDTASFVAAGVVNSTGGKPKAGTYTVQSNLAALGYTLTTNTTATLTINKKSLSVSGVSAVSKVFDGTDNAVIQASNVVFTGLEGSDVVTVAANGKFSDANPGQGKVVSDYLTGTDLSNYQVALGVVTGDITAQTSGAVTPPQTSGAVSAVTSSQTSSTGTANLNPSFNSSPANTINPGAGSASLAQVPTRELIAKAPEAQPQLATNTAQNTAVKPVASADAPQPKSTNAAKDESRANFDNRPIESGQVAKPFILPTQGTVALTNSAGNSTFQLVDTGSITTLSFGKPVATNTNALASTAALLVISVVPNKPVVETAVVIKSSSESISVTSVPKSTVGFSASSALSSVDKAATTIQTTNATLTTSDGSLATITVGVTADGVLVVRVPEQSSNTDNTKSISLIGMVTAKDTFGIDPSSLKGVVIQSVK